MHLPDLPRDLMQWDRYRAFHWTISSSGPSHPSYYTPVVFAVFDTKEVICPMNCPPPDQRRMYESLNVRLVATGDAMCPPLSTPDGREVRPAWLNQRGMQYLLVDYDTGHVVRTDGDRYKLAERLPSRFTAIVARGGDQPSATVSTWFPGPGRPPVGSPINVDVPKTNKEWLTDEQREHIRTITDTCKMTLRLKGITTLGGIGEVGADRLLEVSHFDQLTLPEQMAVANGTVGHVCFPMEHLCVR